MACAKQLAITTILVAILCVPIIGAETNCEDCTTVHRYVNTSGNKYVSFKPNCFSDMSCQDHWQCSTRDRYQITSVAVYVPSDNYDDEVKAYWNDKTVFLEIHSSSMLEPFDIVTTITYICIKQLLTYRHHSLNVTVRLKPIRIELQEHRKDNHEQELDCVISGQFDTNNTITHIHYVHQENDTTVTTDMNCTYDHYHTQNESSSTTTRCAKSVSHLGSGQYYCTVVIGGKYFTSNVKDVKSNGLSKQTIIEISGGAGGALLLMLLVSLMVNMSIIIIWFRRRQQLRIPLILRDAEGAGERQQLIEDDEHRQYQAVEVGLDEPRRLTPSPAHSEDSQNTQVSNPHSIVDLPQQQGNNEESEM